MGNVKERDRMENAGLDGKIILKCIQKMLWNYVIRFHLSQVAGCSVHTWQ